MKKIDFVITWVNGADSKWLAQRNEYRPGRDADAADYRYRDMGILKYWFRAAEKYAPWVNKIHFVTWGHLPAWLNTANPKLNIVKHTDFIPEKYLPTFSSHTIELNLHRIAELSDCFVYFNDDMFLNSEITPEFYFRHGLPCDFAYVNNTYYSDTADIWPHIVINDIWTTNNYFSYMKSFMRRPFKYLNIRYPLKNIVKNIIKLENNNIYPGLEIHHMPSPYLKKSFFEAWEEMPEILDATCRRRFRSPLDVSQSVIRYRQLAKGEFQPVSKKTRGQLFNIGLDLDRLLKTISQGSEKVICINDTTKDIDFNSASRKISAAYAEKLPEKSRFEL